MMCTERQREVLKVIAYWQAARGASPTMREIAKELGMASMSGALKQVNALRRQGLVTTDIATARSIVLTRDGHREMIGQDHAPTAIERRVLETIGKWIQAHTYAPTAREIAEQMGFASHYRVEGHLIGLEAKGLIERTPGVARTMRITDNGWTFL